MSRIGIIDSGIKIVTDGLVLWLDAAQLRSYPTTGTVWSDISGNNNNGTLTNGPTFNSANGGSIVFDGVNDLIMLPTNLYTQNNNPFTISLWFISNQTTGGTIFGQQDTTNPDLATGWVPSIYLKGDGKIRMETFWTGNLNNSFTTVASYNNNLWYNITCTYGVSTETLYINGVLLGTVNGVTQVSYTSTYYYMIGAGYSSERSLGTNYFNGSISQFSFYNRALSATEILQNYNATKDRYGL